MGMLDSLSSFVQSSVVLTPIKPPPVEPKIEKKPFVDKGNVEVSYKNTNQVDLKLNEVQLRAELTTQIGQLNISYTRADGTALNAPFRIKPTIDTSDRDATGNLRAPTEHYESNGFEVGYGAKFSLLDHEVTFGGGYAYTKGDTDKEKGLDSRHLTVSGEKLVFKAKNINHSVGITLGNKDISQTQFYPTGYTFTVDRNIQSVEASYDQSLGKSFELNAQVNLESTNNSISFAYETGIPHLFPDKSAHASLWTAKLGATVKDVSGIDSVSAGVVAKAGSGMADLDSVPVVPEESIGFYMGVQKGDFKYGLSYSPLKLSSRKVDEYGSYFSKNDLNVTSTKNEVAVSVVHPQFEGAVQIEWGETTSKFTSVPPMIAGILQRFDDGANKTTVWKESGVSANLKLNAGLFADSLKNVWLTASGKVTSAEYNQYSTKAINIQSQQSIGVGIQYRF